MLITTEIFSTERPAYQQKIGSDPLRKKVCPALLLQTMLAAMQEFPIYINITYYLILSLTIIFKELLSFDNYGSPAWLSTLHHLDLPPI